MAKRESVKQFLYSIRDEYREIKELEERISELQLSFLPAGIRYDKLNVQTSITDTATEHMAELADYSTRLESKVAALTARRLIAQRLIDTLKESRERQVLDLYFLSEKRLRMGEVAERMGYEERQTYNIYKSALQKLSGKRMQ